MPVTKSAIKAMKQSRKANERNKEVKNDFRVKVKAAKKATTEATKKVTTETTLAIQALDKAAKNNVIHKRTAARRKSRLVKALNVIVGKAIVLPSIKQASDKTVKKTTKKTIKK